MTHPRTSHVGSFPLDYAKDLVERILVELHEIGLSVPPYPQMRSFIDIYLEPLAKRGVLEKRGDFYFAKPESLLEAEPVAEPIPEAEDTVSIVRRRGLSFDELRGPVTGVFTLASRVYLEHNIEAGLRATALARRGLVEEFFVPYVHRYLEYLSKLGYRVLFIDEPILGVIVGRRRILFGYTEDFIYEVLRSVFRGISASMRGIHVCGRISARLFDILSRSEVLDALNFEFFDTPENLGVVDPKALEENKKVLAPGIASAKKPRVESLDEVVTVLRKVYDKANGLIDLVSADCGFGGLKGVVEPGEALRISIGKLRRVVEAVAMLSGGDEAGPLS